MLLLMPISADNTVIHLQYTRYMQNSIPQEREKKMPTHYTKIEDILKAANPQPQKRDTEAIPAEHVTGVATAISHENAQHMARNA